VSSISSRCRFDRKERRCVRLSFAVSGISDHKLVPAVAKAQVARPTQLAQPAAGVRQQLAAHQVAVRIVDQLEAVQVKEGQAHRRPIPSASLKLLRQNIVKMAGVVKARAVVGDAQLLDAGHIARVLNGNGRVVGQNVQEGDGRVVQPVGAGVEDLNDAMRSLAPTQWHGDHRPHSLRFQRPLSAEAGVVIRFGHNQRLAVQCHPAGHALAHLHPQAAQLSLLPAAGDGVVELLSLLIQHQQRPELGFDEVRSICSRIVRRIVSRSKLEVSERVSL
jgi:hypothetical protein